MPSSTARSKSFRTFSVLARRTIVAMRESSACSCWKTTTVLPLISRTSTLLQQKSRLSKQHTDTHNTQHGVRASHSQAAESHFLRGGSSKTNDGGGAHSAAHASQVPLGLHLAAPETIGSA